MSRRIFSFEDIGKFFVICLALYSPGYLIYHHMKYDDFFTKETFVVTKKTDERQSGKYVYTLTLAKDDKVKTVTVDSDKYIHTDIGSKYVEREINMELNKVYLVVTAIEAAIIAFGLLLLFIAAGG